MESEYGNYKMDEAMYIEQLEGENKRLQDEVEVLKAENENISEEMEDARKDIEALSGMAADVSEMVSSLSIELHNLLGRLK